MWFPASEPAHELPYFSYGSAHSRPNILDVSIRTDRLNENVVSLLRGLIFIHGLAALVEHGFAYWVKDEEWQRLGGHATLLIMEEGEMKGPCAKRTINFKTSKKKGWRLKSNDRFDLGVGCWPRSTENVNRQSKCNAQHNEQYHGTRWISVFISIS